MNLLDKGLDVEVHEFKVLVVLSGIGLQRNKSLRYGSPNSISEEVCVRLMYTH